MDQGPDFGRTAAVSVIVPTYNRCRFLLETVESILQQKFRDFELIVVDDGSTDETQEVLKPYGDQVRYLFQENRGAAVARNRGAKAARGEYLAFCDDDDLWRPDHLELLSGLLREHPHAGMAFSNAVFFKESRGHILRPMMREKYVRLLERRALSPSDLFLKSVVATLSVVMVRREAFRAIGCFNEKIKLVDDRDLALRISLRYEIAFLNEVTCCKRLLQQSLTGLIPYDDGYLGIIEEMDAADPMLRARVGRATFACRLAREYVKKGQRCFASGDRKAAAAAFARARHWTWWDLRCHWLWWRSCM